MQSAKDVWRTTYQDEGLVVVRDILDAATVSVLREEMDKITGEREALPLHLKEKIFLERDHVKNNIRWYAGILVPDDCGTAVRQIDDLSLFGSNFARLICLPKLLDVIEALFASPEFSFVHMTGRPQAARVGNGISNGAFQRDAQFLRVTSINALTVILCLDDMTADNGAVSFIRGSHNIPDHEAITPHGQVVPIDHPDAGSKVRVNCPAGSGIFLSAKVLHAIDHNRSDHPRRTVHSEWAGPGVLPTSPDRHAHQGLRLRSRDALYQQQTRMSFPR